MTVPHALIEGLRRWPQLWQHPRLFSRVMGAAGEPHRPHALLDDLLTMEVADPREALSVICDSHDLAAAHEAQRILAPLVGMSAAYDAYKRAQRDFERRMAQVVARARPLSARKSVDAALAGIEGSLRADPHAAELGLRAASRATEAAESKDLEALERAFPRPEAPSPRWQRFDDALSAGNLRLAQIYSAHLEEPCSTTAGEATYDWTGSASDQNLVGWLLDPAIAPGWLPRVDLQEADLLFLATLARAMEGPPIDEPAAQGLARAMLGFLFTDEPERAAEPFRAHSPTESQEISSFAVGSGDADRLFPHLAGGEAVTLLIPHHPSALLPETGRAMVALDLFDTWRGQGGTETLVVTPRMLLQLVPFRRDRRARFVALVSHSIPLPTLINHFLDQSGYRARLIAGDASNEQGPVERPFVERLVNGLDLYVDDGDIDALYDASGASLSLLLRILKLVGKTLGSPPTDERRFDALSFLTSVEGEELVEKVIKEHAEEQFGRSWHDLSSLAKNVSFELELLQSVGEQPPTIASLAQALVRDEAAATVEAASQDIQLLLSAGILEEVRASETGAIALARGDLTLFYRMLLRE